MDIIVKYGSKARGDSDSLSDCDILVIGKIPNEYQSSKSEVVRYTKNRLEKLKIMKSLFLIHLREEGVILQDQNNWMNRFLKSIPDYTPNDDVLAKAFQNLEVITSIAPTASGVPCWFDMIFVFLRDLLIKLNALNKNYVFAPDCLLESIELQHKKQIQSIVNISREIKSNYRSNVHQNIFMNPFKVSELLVKSFNLNTNHVDLWEIINRPTNADPYLVLRLVEYGICTGHIKSINEKLFQYIKKPNRYAWEIKKIKWSDMIEFVEPTAVADR